MALTKVNNRMIDGATVNVFDFLTAAEIEDVQSRTENLDVTANLQAAIDSGTDIFFPPGLYKITAPLVVSSKKSIRGPINSVINNAASAPCLIHKVTNTVDSQGLDSIISIHDDVESPPYAPELKSESVSISGLTLFGNNPSSSLSIVSGGSSSTNAYGVFRGSGENFKARDLTIVNCDDILHIQRCWLSEVSNVVGYGRIYQGGGTSTVYNSCEAGFNNREGYYISGSYITMNCCASDVGAYGRYKFDSVRGLTVNSCAVENINEALGTGYDYSGKGAYIQFLGNNEATVNSFRAFDQISGDSDAPTDFIHYISLDTDDEVTFISDAIDRQLPPHSTTDKAYKMFYINDNAKVTIINPHNYLGAPNYLRSYNSTFAGGATLEQISSTDSEAFTPSFELGGTPAVTYAVRKGFFSIMNDILYINVHVYIRSKNGTGNMVITGLPAGVVSTGIRIPVQVTNLSGSVYSAVGTFDASGDCALFDAATGAALDDTNVPSNPFVNVFIDATINLAL